MLLCTCILVYIDRTVIYREKNGKKEQQALVRRLEAGRDQAETRACYTQMASSVLKYELAKEKAETGRLHKETWKQYSTIPHSVCNDTSQF